MSQLFASRGQSLWSFSFSISPSNEYSGLISFRIDWFDFLAVQGTLKSLNQHYNLKASILQCTAFFTVQLSHPYTITRNTIALITWMFVGKVMSVCSISPTNVLLNPTVKGGFSGGTVVKKKKNPSANAGDTRNMGSIPGLGRSPGEGNGKPLQYSYLGNPMDRGAWWATVHGVTMDWTRLIMHNHEKETGTVEALHT